jgi:hypothetical protein
MDFDNPAPNPKAATRAKLSEVSKVTAVCHDPHFADAAVKFGVLPPHYADVAELRYVVFGARFTVFSTLHSTTDAPFDCRSVCFICFIWTDDDAPSVSFSWAFSSDEPQAPCAAGTAGAAGAIHVTTAVDVNYLTTGTGVALATWSSFTSSRTASPARRRAW